MLGLIGVLASCAEPVCKCGMERCNYPDVRTHQAPSWLCAVTIPGYTHIAVGYADKSPGGESLTRRMAVTMAYKKLNKKNIDSTKAKIIKVTISPKQRVYVMVGVKNK